MAKETQGFDRLDLTDSAHQRVCCKACGYDLRSVHVGMGCPECGHPVVRSVAHQAAKNLGLRSWYWRIWPFVWVLGSVMTFLILADYWSPKSGCLIGFRPETGLAILLLPFVLLIWASLLCSFVDGKRWVVFKQTTLRPKQNKRAMVGLLAMVGLAVLVCAALVLSFCMDWFGPWLRAHGLEMGPELDVFSASLLMVHVAFVAGGVRIAALFGGPTAATSGSNRKHMVWMPKVAVLFHVVWLTGFALVNRWWWATEGNHHNTMFQNVPIVFEVFVGGLFACWTSALVVTWSQVSQWKQAWLERLPGMVLKSRNKNSVVEAVLATSADLQDDSAKPWLDEIQS